MGEKTKVCNPNSGCGRTFPATLDFFHANWSNKGGLSTKCKECSNAYSKKKYHASKGTRVVNEDREFNSGGCWMNGIDELFC